MKDKSRLNASVEYKALLVILIVVAFSAVVLAFVLWLQLIQHRRSEGETHQGLAKNREALESCQTSMRDTEARSAVDAAALKEIRGKLADSMQARSNVNEQIEECRKELRDARSRATAQEQQATRQSAIIQTLENRNTRLETAAREIFGVYCLANGANYSVQFQTSHDNAGWTGDTIAAGATVSYSVQAKTSSIRFWSSGRINEGQQRDYSLYTIYSIGSKPSAEQLKSCPRHCFALEKDGLQLRSC